MEANAPASRAPLSQDERMFMAIEVVLGLGLCSFGVGGLVLFELRDYTNQVAGLLLLPLIFAAPSGLLFWIAAVAMWKRWPCRDWFHALPFLWPGAVMLLLWLNCL